MSREKQDRRRFLKGGVAMAGLAVGAGAMSSARGQAAEPQGSALKDLRVGVLVPAGNIMHEREFLRLRPEGVSFRFGSFSYPSTDPESFCSTFAESLAGPIQDLKGWGAQLVLVGCTTASMTCYEEAFHAALEERAGLPIVTAAGASKQALRALGVHSLGVGTPYGERGNRIIADYLRAQGFALEALRGLAFDRSAEIWLQNVPRLTPQQVLELALSVDVPGVQGLYLPCAAVGTIEAIDLFERERGKPAVSSVQAGYWASLRRLGFDGRRSEGGRLLREWDF